MALIFISANIAAVTQIIAGPVGKSKKKLALMPIAHEKQLIKVDHKSILKGVFDMRLAAAAGIIANAGANKAPNIFITMPIINAYPRKRKRRTIFEGYPWTCARSASKLVIKIAGQYLIMALHKITKDAISKIISEVLALNKSPKSKVFGSRFAFGNREMTNMLSERQL